MRVARFFPLVFALALAPAMSSQAGPQAKQEPRKNPDKGGRVDLFGDPLPEGAVARIGTSRWRTYESPLAFSPDGRQLIATGYQTRLIDALSGKLLRKFDFGSEQGLFLGDNTIVVISSGNDRTASMIRFLNAETGNVLRQLQVDGQRCVFSADGKRLACINLAKSPRNWDIAVWDLDAGKEIRQWKTPNFQFALSSDGQTLAVRLLSYVALLSVDNGKELHRWEVESLGGGGDTVNNQRMVFSPKGNAIACTMGGGVKLWDPTTGKAVAKSKLGPVLPTGKDMAVTLAFSSDGRYLAAGCSYGKIYLWDLQDDKLLYTIPGDGTGRPIYILTFTPDCKTLISQPHLSASSRLWTIATGEEAFPSTGNLNLVDSLAFSDDAKLIATTGPGNLTCLWEAASGKLLRGFRHQAYGGDLRGKLAFLPGRNLLTMKLLSYVAAWNLDDGKALYETKTDGLFKPYGEGKDQLIYTNCGLDEHTMLVVFPSDEKQVLPRDLVSSLMIGRWDARTAKTTDSFPILPERLDQLYISKDRKVVLGFGWLSNMDQQYRLFAWRIADGKELFRIILHRFHYVEDLSLSSDVRSVLISTGHRDSGNTKNGFYLIEVASGKERALFEHKTDSGTKAYAIIANETLVAVAEDRTISLIDPISGKLLRRFNSDQTRITSLSFSACARFVASGGADTTTLIWDISDIIRFPEKLNLSEKNLADHWIDLVTDDASLAFRAIRRICQAPEQSVTFLKRRMQPTEIIPPEKIKQLTAQLDSQRFADREQAAMELLQLGELAEPALTDLLKKPASLEAKTRAAEVLKKLQEKSAKGPWNLSGEPLREARVIEILERIATAEAKEFLAILATGSPHSVLTREARASVQRLAK